MIIQVYISYVQDYPSLIFLAELWPLMLIIYSEPEFVGRDSCYKLLPQHFFVNFQIKSIKLCNELKVGATDLTEPSPTQISMFTFFTIKSENLR